VSKFEAATWKSAFSFSSLFASSSAAGKKGEGGGRKEWGADARFGSNLRRKEETWFLVLDYSFSLLFFALIRKGKGRKKRKGEMDVNRRTKQFGKGGEGGSLSVHGPASQPSSSRKGRGGGRGRGKKGKKKKRGENVLAGQSCHKKRTILAGTAGSFFRRPFHSVMGGEGGKKKGKGGALGGLGLPAGGGNTLDWFKLAMPQWLKKGNSVLGPWQEGQEGDGRQPSVIFSQREERRGGGKTGNALVPCQRRNKNDATASTPRLSCWVSSGQPRRGSGVRRGKKKKERGAFPRQLRQG